MRNGTPSTQGNGSLIRFRRRKPYGEHYIYVGACRVRVSRRIQRAWEHFASRWLSGAHTYSHYPEKR